jgi:ferric-dicitrate binding protein FerR (iron transport regulator)
MTNNYVNTGQNPAVKGESTNFFNEVSISYNKTKEEAWADIEGKLTEKRRAEIQLFHSRRLIIGIAASLLLLAGIFSILRFYTSAISCPPGQHLSCSLPDGSTIELNAVSKVVYRPLWWRFERKLSFNGEGFFRVEKGKKFEVVSENGRTIVLGTSFNIYSREREYIVSCFTGKVKVISITSEETILSPDQTASISPEGRISLSKEDGPGVSNAWMNNMFRFTGRPLKQVFNEIGRQYAVTIIFNPTQDYAYTGYFSKDKPVEETLALICKPFGLTFARNSEKEYEISQN